MKEKLLALLVAKFAGVPESVLERIATKKAGSVSDEAQLQSIADGIDYGQLLQSEVDTRLTDSNKKAVQNYEATHKLKDGKPIETGTEPDPEIERKRKEAEASNPLAKQLNELKARLDAQEKKETSLKLQSDFTAKLAEKKIPAQFAQGIVVNTPEEIETALQTAENNFLSVKQHLVNEGIVKEIPQAPAGGNGVSSDVQVFLDSKQGKGEAELGGKKI
jgi:hypothetical protein